VGDSGLNKNRIKQYLSVSICLVIPGLKFHQKNFRFLFFGLGKALLLLKVELNQLCEPIQACFVQNTVYRLH